MDLAVQNIACCKVSLPLFTARFHSFVLKIALSPALSVKLQTREFSLLSGRSCVFADVAERIVNTADAKALYFIFEQVE